MQLFYTTNIDGEYAEFDEVESRHAVQVLRKKVGDTLNFIDGKGGRYQGIVDVAGKKKLVVKISSAAQVENHLGFNLHIGIAPTKNIDRLEWFLEKSTEVGISSITPLLCEHSERKKVRMDRLKKILLSATKQSLKAHLPKLHEITDFQGFIQNLETTNVEQRFIAHCQKNDLTHLKNNCKAGKDVLILIGPEGDFSNAEIKLAIENGFTEIGLGKSRLRTETAGLTAVITANLLNE